MKIFTFIILLASLFFTGCYVPNQTVWQGDSSAYGTPRPPVPRPGPLNTKSGPSEGMPSKPGSCYAKCLIPATKNSGNFLALLPIYIGDPTNNNVVLDTIEIEMQASGTKWVKKKADRNCLSANPEDCLVWCMVETERVVESYIVVKDTSETDQFEMTEIYREDESEQYGGLTEWREIVCDTKITRGLIEDVQVFLIEENYLFGEPTGKLDGPTRNALTEYQRLNDLPIGQLDFETLDAMGARY